MGSIETTHNVGDGVQDGYGTPCTVRAIRVGYLVEYENGSTQIWDEGFPIPAADSERGLGA